MNVALIVVGSVAVPADLWRNAPLLMLVALYFTGLYAFG